MQVVKTIGAGRWRFSVAYRKRERSDSPKARAAKTEHSTAAQRILNRRLSHVGLTGIIAENFADNPDAKFVTLTFDSNHYPDGKETELFDFAYNQAKLFLQRAKRLLKPRQEEMRSVFVVGGGNNIRYHIHFVLDGLSGADLRALWDRGNVDYHLLDDRQDDPMKWDFVRDNGNVDPAQIAGYMMENAIYCPLGRHPWHASKNCVRAETVEQFEIADNTPIPMPEDADVIVQETKSNAYSEFKILELILPKQDNVPISPRLTDRLVS